MKLTKKQKEEFLNFLHVGVGEILIKIKDNAILETTINLGRNGKWYTGKRELIEFLNEIAQEIQKYET